MVNKTVKDAPHVIVVGAGFGGLNAVHGLDHENVRVTLVDRNLYSTFQPLLYQVATGGLNPGDVAYPSGGYTRRHHARYMRGELAAIDPGGRRVKLADGRELEYDYLVIGTGVTAAYFGIKGAAENTFGLYTRRDAIVLRDHIMAGFERLSAHADQQQDERAGTAASTQDGAAAQNTRDEQEKQDAEFAVTVVGGGATGVELAGTLAELRSTVLKATFPNVRPAQVEVRLVEMAPGLLMPFNPKLRDYALRQLIKRGVDVRLDTKIEEVTPSTVVISGRPHRSDLTVWAAGVSAATGWGLPQGKQGRILVDRDLRVTGQNRIFAVGDIAMNPDDPTPMLAQPAIQHGKFAAAQIKRLLAGEETTAFGYHDKGIMATIGRRSAVVQLARGLRITGTLAWLAWLVLHLYYLVGGRNRIATMVNLAWRYIAWGHGGGVIVGDEPPVYDKT